MKWRQWLRRRSQKRVLRLTYAGPSALRLVAGLAVLVLVGTILLLLPGVSTHGLRLNQAMFTATSALSVTGLSIITPATDLTLAGQIVLLCLIQVGGVGFMVIAVAFLRLMGRKISLQERLALQDSLGLNLPRAILRLASRVVLAMAIMEGLGALALWLHWRSLLGDARALLYGIFHAVSSFCNAGFDLFTGTPGFDNGIPRDAVTLTILSMLIVAGGLGIPVWSDLIGRRRRLTLHTRVTLAVAATLIVAGGLGIYFSETRSGGTLVGAPFLNGLGISLFQSVSARTAGFSALPQFDRLQPATQWLLAGLMFVGGSPASMGGGITTGTFAVLVLTMWGYIRGWPAAQVGGRTVSAETARRATAVLIVSAFLVASMTWILLMTQTATLDQALFEVVSGFATTGLSLNFTGKLNVFGQVVIMLVMFWGRLGALTIVLALGRQAPPQPVTYPEEQLLIG